LAADELVADSGEEIEAGAAGELLALAVVEAVSVSGVPPGADVAAGISSSFPCDVPAASSLSVCEPSTDPDRRAQLIAHDA
jgi:hypothetical protein